MTELSTTPSRRGARTFRASCIVLATVAAAQAATSALTSRHAEKRGDRESGFPACSGPEQ